MGGDTPGTSAAWLLMVHLGAVSPRFGRNAFVTALWFQFQTKSVLFPVLWPLLVMAAADWLALVS